MARVQGVNCHGELLSSAYVSRDTDYGVANEEPSLTRQEFAEECDINTLMAKYDKVGFPMHMSKGPGQYLDVSDVPDLQRAMQVLADAERAFMTLPARTRFEFGNDPAKFVEFAQDPANNAQMREWGLTEPLPEPPAPQEVKIVADDRPPPEAP